MSQKLQAISGAILLLLLPVLAFAQEELTGVGKAVDSVTGIVESLIPLLLTIAVVIFLWGVVKYIFKIGGEEGSKGGLKVMMWGIVAIFVMVSVWGLVKLLQTTLNVGGADGSDVADPGSLQVVPDRE